MRWIVAVVSLLTVGCRAETTPCPASEAPLVIRQLSLPGPTIGVATAVHLPDGRALLIEVGNDAHDAIVREAVPAAAFVLVSHDDADHADGRADLADVLADAVEIDALGVWDLGGGVSLDVFLVDGVLRTPMGDVDLRAEVPSLDDDANPRSTGAILRFGAFDWLVAGDLTGGGKGTADVESAVASRGDALLAPGAIDLLSLSHHGISSSTNEAWVDWLLPDDGRLRHALVATSGAYLAAPHEDVLDRVGPRLGGGRVWVGEPGQLTPRGHPDLAITGGEVVIGVQADGLRWAVCGQEAEAG